MKKLVSLLCCALVGATLAGCTPATSSSEQSNNQNNAAAATRTVTDPSGAVIEVPHEVNSVVVLAPATSEILVDLGCTDTIVAYDMQSAFVEGMPEGLPQVDMMNPDMEVIASLKPDVMFVSNMTMYDQENPYQQLIDNGTCVVTIPTSDSIEDIKNDVQFTADVMGKSAEGKALIDDMQSKIDEIVNTVKDAPKKSAYFEIAAAPDMYSTGSGTYLNEMMELAGLENVLAGTEGWTGVDGETLASLNPEVIFTNVTYVEDPIAEILSREGWAGVTAIQSGDVYSIDNYASSNANHRIVKALDQMARAAHPELF